MRTVIVENVVDDADVDGVVDGAVLAAPGPLPLNGDLVVDGSAYLGPTQQRVGFTSTGDVSTVIFTITGRDAKGDTVVEEVSNLADGNPVDSVNYYLWIDSIVADDDTATFAIDVGTIEEAASLPIPCDQYLTPFQLSLWVNFLDGSSDVTVQYTGSDVWKLPQVDLHWIDHTALTGLTGTDAVGTVISPVTAMRLITNSGGGVAELIVQQAGIQ